MGKRALFLVSVILFLSQVCISQATKSPKVAVVLSGGGAKGFAHIGVLKVLEEEGIPIDIIVGTSMGSIVGGLYSIGYNADSIAMIARSEDWAELLSDEIPRRDLDLNSRTEKQRYLLRFPLNDGKKPAIPNGMIRGQNIINRFCELTANVPADADFSKFPVSFACIGTDLATGEEVVINSGFLPTAMFSSMAIPGVFIPGEYNGRLLVDGGLVNNFPADVAKKMGADIITGVDATVKLHPENDIGSISDVMDQLINFFVQKKNSSNKAICDLIIHPDTKDFEVTSFNTAAVDSLINRGISAARKAGDELEKLKSANSLYRDPPNTSLLKDDKWQIDGITFSGNYSMSDSYLENAIELDVPGQHSFPDIEEAVNTLYGTGNFTRAFFRLEDNERSKNLNIVLDETRKQDINVGMRLNSSEGVSVVLNSTRMDYMKTFGLISLTADISFNPEISLLLEMNKRKMPKLSFMVDGMYRHFNVHVNRKDYYPTDLLLVSAKLFLSQKALGNSMAGTGLKQEYYYGSLYSLVSDTIPVITTKEKSITSFFIFLSHDNLNDYYFPSRGSEFYFEISAVPQKGFEDINSIVLVRDRNIIRINTTFSTLINFYGRAVLSEKTPGQLGNFAGGHDYEISLDNNLPFYGLPSLYTTERQSLIGMLGVRANLTHNHYITVISNIMFHSAEFYPINEFRSLSGYGLTYSYDSTIGPIEVTVGYSDRYRSPTLSADIGLWF